MSSKIVEIVELHCDGEGCDAVYRDTQDNPLLARDMARKVDGWFGGRGKDYCPECAERYKIVRYFACGMQGPDPVNHERLHFYWRHLSAKCKTHFGGEEDFIAEVEAEIAGRENPIEIEGKARLKFKPCKGS